MKKMTRNVLLVLGVVLAFGFAACDSDSGSTTPPADTTGGVDQGGGMDVPPVEEDTADEPAGACDNEADLAAIAAGRDAITAKARECGLGCLTDADPVQCSVPCITAEHAISAECAACYGGTIACTIQNCVAQCVADASSEPCVACQEEKGCLSNFYACSGLEPEAE